MLTQRRWRIAGGILLAISAVMAYLGVKIPAIHTSLPIFVAYWGLFLLAFVMAIYCAILDFAYVRLQLKAQERELYRETLGDESFRKALRQAQEEKARKSRGGDSA